MNICTILDFGEKCFHLTVIFPRGGWGSLGDVFEGKGSLSYDLYTPVHCTIEVKFKLLMMEKSWM